MDDAERTVRAFILGKARALADHPTDELEPSERAYLTGLIAEMTADPEHLPLLDPEKGRFLVYELQEHLHFDYAEGEADRLYERFVGEEADDVRELYVAIDKKAERAPEES